MSRPTALGLVIAALTVVADQLGKWWIVAAIMDPPRVIPIAPFFNLVPVLNRGVSFGLFASGSVWTPWILGAVAIAVVAMLLIWLRKADDRLLGAALGLIIGGAVGNVIDRARFGAVVDFLDFFVGRYHWPAFNIADSAITVGVVVLLIDGLIGDRRGRKL